MCKKNLCTSISSSFTEGLNGRLFLGRVQWLPVVAVWFPGNIQRLPCFQSLCFSKLGCDIIFRVSSDSQWESKHQMNNIQYIHIQCCCINNQKLEICSSNGPHGKVEWRSAAVYSYEKKNTWCLQMNVHYRDCHTMIVPGTTCTGYTAQGSFQ